MKRISLAQVETSERFYRIPKALFSEPKYREMKLESKTAYAILKDRFELSIVNNFIDYQGNVYLIFKNSDLQNLLGVGEKKVIAIKKELNAFGLLEEERQGLNLPNRIYIGNLEIENNVIHRVEALGDKELSKRQYRNCQNDSSRTAKTTVQELSKRQSNDTEINDTELSDTDSFKKDDEEELINNNAAPVDENHQEETITQPPSSENAFGEIAKLLESHQNLKRVFTNLFEDIFFNEPQQAAIVLKSLVKQKEHLTEVLRDGNRMLQDGIAIQGQDYLIQLIEQESKKQLVHMKEHLVNSEAFGNYFDQGLTSRIKIATNTIYTPQLF
ncbi:replication initiator protein A [Leuconostoc citreum]|uniref:replication initiator protein A n=1 Tax=Leuconostoc citreum TaxID=33964 RepID=UPI0032DF118D